MNRVLIAGIGNIFLGDDAFGCEVIRELSSRELPAGAQALDFGIRGYDLAYALAAGWEAVILVDAAPLGEPAGTLFLIEPDLEQLDSSGPALADAHSLDPVSVLKMAQALGRCPQHLYLVGCEPATVEPEEGRIGLSAPVQAAVPQAIKMIATLLGKLLSSKTKSGASAGPVPV